MTNLKFLWIIAFVAFSFNFSFAIASVSVSLSPDNIEDLDLVQLSLQNPGDLYLVAQGIVVGAAIQCCLYGIRINPKTPFGYAVNQLYVENCNCQLGENVFVWNKVSGQLLLIIPNTIIDDMELSIATSALAVNPLIYEIAYNELLGINTSLISLCTYNLFKQAGNLIAKLIGVGCSPSILVNLNGMVMLIASLPPQLCIISASSRLGPMANINDIYVLVEEITGISILLEAYAHWSNNKYIFHDARYPRQTQSGCMIGHLLGDKDLVATIPGAILQGMQVMSSTEIYQTLLEFAVSFAIDGHMEGMCGLFQCDIDCPASW